MVEIRLTYEQLARVFEMQQRALRVRPEGQLNIVTRADRSPQDLGKAMASYFLQTLAATYGADGALRPAAERPEHEPSPDYWVDAERRSLGLALQMAKRGRITERDIESGLFDLLKSEGMGPKRQVRTTNGIADIVVGDFVIEVKPKIESWAALHKACGQASAYAESLSKKFGLVTGKSINDSLIGKGHANAVCVALERVVDYLKENGVSVGQQDDSETDPPAITGQAA